MNESIFDELQRHTTCLTLALRVRDDIAAIVAAARLRQLFARAAGQLSPDDTGIARLLLASTPSEATGDHRLRLLRWCSQAERSPERPDGPDLFEVDAVRLDLGLARMSALYVSSSVFWAGSLVGATLDGARLEHCDFARANLERTMWRGARVYDCSLAGAVLADATLDDARFVDCDLRGADLSVVRRGRAASTARATFLRCDLRETSWDLRELDRVQLIDCRLHGTHGTPSLDEVEIRRPDMSPDGDGSVIGVPDDVVRSWRTLS